MEIYCQDTHITVVDIISHFEGWTPDCFCFFFVSYRGCGSHEQKKMRIIIIKPSYYLTPWVLYTAQVLNRFSIRKETLGESHEALLEPMTSAYIIHNCLSIYYIPPPTHPCASSFWYVFQGAQPALKKRKKKKKKKMWRWPRRLKYIVYASLLPLLIFTVLSCAGCVV